MSHTLSRKRRRFWHKSGCYNTGLKEKVSLEALERKKTLQQIVSENVIDPELVAGLRNKHWKGNSNLQM